MEAVSVEGVTAGYMGRAVVEGISFTVEEGEIYVLLGPNGAGKTTTFRIVAGVLPPFKGRVSVKGLDVWGDEGLEARKSIGFLPEGERAYTFFTVRENLEFFAKLYGAPASAVDEAIEKLGLTRYSDVQAFRLSRGLRKRLALARAILHDPDVLVLDEPFSGLDAASITAFREFIVNAARSGKAVLLSTHILSELQYLEETRCRVGVIVNGRLVVEKELSEVASLIPYTDALLRVDAQKIDDACRALEVMGYSVEKHRFSIVIKRVRYDKDVPLLVKSLVEKGISVYEVRPREPPIQDLLKKLGKEST